MVITICNIFKRRNDRHMPDWFAFAGTIVTPGKLSQVPPAEVLIIGCDRHPEVPVTIEI